MNAILLSTSMQLFDYEIWQNIVFVVGGGKTKCRKIDILSINRLELEFRAKVRGRNAGKSRAGVPCLVAGTPPATGPLAGSSQLPPRTPCDGFPTSQKSKGLCIPLCVSLSLLVVVVVVVVVVFLSFRKGDFNVVNIGKRFHKE